MCNFILEMRLLVFLVLAFLVSSLNAQKISGIVKDSSTNEVLPFANIYVPETSFGTNSDDEGRFKMDVPETDFELHISILTYETQIIKLNIRQDTFIEIEMVPTKVEIDGVTVEAKKTRIGNKIIRKLQANKDKILTENSTYSNDNYIKTQMEKYRPASEPEDTIVVEEGYDIVYLSETASRQHYSNRKFKSEVLGELVNNTENELKRWARMDVDREFRGSSQGTEYNPIEFFRTSQEANVEIYRNTINNQTLADRPITSPLGAGAFTNYRFRLQEITVREGDSIFRVSVEPIFKKAPLFNGYLIVNGSDWVVESAELSLANNVINAFRDFTFKVSYEEVGEGKWKSVDRSFFYTAKWGKKEYDVNTQIIDSNFELNPNFPKNFFGSEVIKYTEEALGRDTAIWDKLRPQNIHISNEERQFIIERDSAWTYDHSEEYYMAQDSDYNKITLLNVLWSGVNYRNRARGLTLGFNSLAESIRVFGVGGYRFNLGGNVEKEFPSSNKIGVGYNLSYGFNNNDIKGSIRVAYTYMPQKFARFYVRLGDTYDLLTTNESLQNIVRVSNYIRHQRIGVGHVFEVFNGLYLGAEVHFADKRDLDDIDLSNDIRLSIFGSADIISDFPRYKSFIFETDITYKFGQKYITKGRKKVILGNNYPTLNFKYKKGIPTIFGSEVNYDHVELRLSQEMPYTKFGNANWYALVGSFLNTKSLRVVENRFFRGSTPYLFADPLRDYQLLSATQQTRETYIQGMFIHHFNGFIMDKIPLLNFLQLELSVGAAALALPEQDFLHAEMYAGIGRKFTIRGEQFQVSAYAATADSSIDKLTFQYKFGVNFYNAFTGKWAY